MSTEQARNEPRTATEGRFPSRAEVQRALAALDHTGTLAEAIVKTVCLSYAEGWIVPRREAIADFLDHDLPGLLAEALRSMDAPDPYSPRWDELQSDYAALLIAAIRQRIAERA